MSEAPLQSPVPQPAPPSPPGRGASRYEWRDYRHRMHAYIRTQRHTGVWYGPYGWGMFFAAALILIGGYYLLRNLGLLPGVHDDVVWPMLLILLGVVLLAERVRR